MGYIIRDTVRGTAKADSRGIGSVTRMKGTANKASSFLTKYAMVIALVIVFVLFAYLTDWRLLYPQNMSNLMLQIGYVLVMACGMLLCILTGGNIDLSIGSVICLVGGLAAVMITNMSMNPILTIVICLVVGLLVGVWQGYWIGYVRIPPSSPPWAACSSSAASAV